MHKIREMLMKEVEPFEKKTQMSTADLDKLEKMTNIIKNTYKIEMYEDGGYSEDGHYMGEGRIYGTSYDGGSSYARGRGDNAKRDRMGRYSRDGGYAEDGRGGSNRGYSYGGYSYKDKDDMLEHLHEMMGEASTTKEREAIKRCIREMEDD